mmetsp:Transcript_27162/g.59530  ORF Transcript_27162/g.59530 Transcript_27162/m.59530 type:complete len:176 (-) Transcript_27162:88-615(-)
MLGAMKLISLQASFLLFTVVASQDGPSSSISAISLSGEDTKDVLAKSVNTTEKLRHTVLSVFQKSQEEVKALKTLLTTNAKAVGAMNGLLLEMENLNKRLTRFGTAMEDCRRELSTIEAQEKDVLTPVEADDPTAASLLQLAQHAEKLSRQARAASAAQLLGGGMGRHHGLSKLF